MGEDIDDETDEVTFDYNVENEGRTHLLIVEFPSPCDEECFLIALKAYLKAQNENLKRAYSEIKYN